MAKRPKSKTTAVPKQKRLKTSSDQSLIQHFFSPGRKSGKLLSQGSADDVTPNASNSSSRENLAGGLSIVPGKESPIEIIDVDLLEASETEKTLQKASGSSLQARDGVNLITRLGSSTTIMKSTAFRGNVYVDLTRDPATYTPQLKPWETATLPYSFLAHTLSTLTQTRSRIIINNVLTNAFRTVILNDPTSLLPAIYLLSNTLAPPYAAVELGLGPSIISRSIQHVSGLSSSAIKRLYKNTGDVGDVAFAAKSNLRTLLPHPPLLVNGIYASLLKITQCQGQGATKEKQKIVENLLLAANGEEIRFLTRTLSQNLRVGAVRASILAALSRAMVLTPIEHFKHDDGTSSYHASPSLLAKVTPLSIEKSKVASTAREELAVKFSMAEILVKRVYVQHPNYEHIATALLEDGLDGLEDRVGLTIGIPLLPTLGSPTHSLDEIYDISGERPFMAEFKYDGQRAQIHAFIEHSETFVKIFSRHLEDMTSMYPDVVCMITSIFKDHPDITSFIMDSEIVAIDPERGLKSFQELSTRARKNVKLQDVRIPVSIFAFDLMYINGKILLECPFRERRTILHSKFPPFTSTDKGVACFNHVESCGSDQGKSAIEAFWKRAIESCCEGLMVKLLDNELMTEDGCDKASKSRKKQLPATYEPDKRTSAWLKLKKDYVEGLGDTLDLIPIGAWHGNGRKTQWWSPILLGLWQPDLGQVVAVSHERNQDLVMSSTRFWWQELAERYLLSANSATCSPQPLWECDTGGLKPEVYFKPQEVWEIRGADITLSPISVAAKGLVSDDKGLSIRFPRFVSVCEKGIEQASTPEFLANMWRKQQIRGGMQRDDEGKFINPDVEARVSSEDDRDFF